MTSDELKVIVQKLPETLQASYDAKGAQYFIRYYNNWVIKEPQTEPPFTDGRTQKTIDPQRTLKKLNMIKGMNIEWLHIPETYLNEEYDILIQRKIIE